MLLWALLASGQIQMRKVDGWETLSQPLEPIPLDLAACKPISHVPGAQCQGISTAFATRPLSYPAKIWFFPLVDADQTITSHRGSADPTNRKAEHGMWSKRETSSGVITAVLRDDL